MRSHAENAENAEANLPAVRPAPPGWVIDVRQETKTAGEKRCCFRFRTHIDRPPPKAADGRHVFLLGALGVLGVS